MGTAFLTENYQEFYSYAKWRRLTSPADPFSDISCYGYCPKYFHSPPRPVTAPLAVLDPHPESRQRERADDGDDGNAQPDELS